MKRVKKVYLKITCEACRREGPADELTPKLCRSCAGRIRYADNAASSIAGIHRDMKSAGIPIGRKG